MPLDWVNCTVGEFEERDEIELTTGPFGTQLKAAEYVECGIPVINVRNIGFGNIRNEKLEYLSDVTVRRLSRHLLQSGDIVFGRKGAVERHAFIQSAQNGWFQGSDCLRLRVKTERLNPRYLSYCFLTHDHQQWMMNQCSHGATMSSLNQDILKRIPLRLPPLPTQRKIAAILSAYDDLIENNLRRIKILEEMAQNLYREWFVKFRFPGHQQARFVDSALGRIPEGWEIGRLIDACHLTMGQSPKSEFYNTEGIGLPFHQGVTDFGDRFPTERLYCTVDNRVAEQGDILFSVRAPVGRINIAITKIVIGRGLSAIRHKAGFQWFAFHLLKENFKEVDTMGGGTIFKSVTKNDMAGIQFTIPAESLMQQFEQLVEPLDQQIENLTRRNITLRRTRDLLLPKLISGAVDVSALDIAIPEEVQA